MHVIWWLGKIVKEETTNLQCVLEIETFCSLNCFCLDLQFGFWMVFLFLFCIFLFLLLFYYISLYIILIYIPLIFFSSFLSLPCYYCFQILFCCFCCFWLWLRCGRLIILKKFFLSRLQLVFRCVVCVCVCDILVTCYFSLSESSSSI